MARSIVEPSRGGSLRDKDAFSVLGTEIEGDLILVNMRHGLVDITIPSEFAAERERLLAYFENLAEWFDALPDHVHDIRKFFEAVYKSVWQSKKVPLMRQGRVMPGPHERLVAMKSLASLREFIEVELPTTDLAKFVKRLPDSFDTSPGKCQELATQINNLSGISLPLARIGRTVWYTREVDCSTVAKWDKAGTDPNDALATDLRNWLGLGHVVDGMPLFAFRSRRGATGLELRRALAVDAIDQRWFKYKPDGTYPGDDWGRAMHLLKMVSSNGDGGPEAVGAGLHAPVDLECLYIGRPIDTAPAPGLAYVDRLAKPDATSEKHALANALWP
jgi:hypothetical protein